jgi:hypothetical protein
VDEIRYGAEQKTKIKLKERKTSGKEKKSKYTKGKRVNEEKQ